MKRGLLFIAMLLCCFGISAKKKVIYVEYFSYGSNVSDARVEQVRNAIIATLTSYPHLQVVDVASQKSLAVEKSRRSGEDALEDETARIGKMKQLGADYLIQGYIPSMEINEKKEYNRDGSLDRIEYKASVSYSIKVIDCVSGALLSTDVFSEMSEDDSDLVEESVNKVLAKIPENLSPIVTKNFKLNSIVLDSDYESKKGKLIRCYINLGEDDGVTPGTIFTVKKAVIKVGRVSWSEIGELLVEKVVAGDVALCKVTLGMKEMFAAMEEIIAIRDSDPENAHDLIVESKSFK